LPEEQPFLEPVRALLADGRSLGERARAESLADAGDGLHPLTSIV
jgi:hypothetical protein